MTAPAPRRRIYSIDEIVDMMRARTGELVENSVCSILEHTAADGKKYSAK